VLFHKQVDSKCLMKASNVFTLAIVLTFLTAFSVFALEPKDFSFEDALFESVSAFSTVGFSMGLTGEWSTACNFGRLMAMF
uniref:potassium transporter TrkG n=1 Tax=Dialister succinatiphilus TaxID=487173 RepID=UPI004038DEC5